MSNAYFLTLRVNDQSFKVSYFKGFEALSRNFYGKLILLSEKPWENPAAFVGENASLEIKTNKQLRYFNGFITRMSHAIFPNSDGLYELKISLCSWPALFKETQEYQIFENKNVLEIFESLFKTHPHCLVDYSKLHNSYPKLDYCVQYQESRSRFMRRLLSSAKIQTYFEHQKDSHRLILIDHPTEEISHFDEHTFWQWHSFHVAFNKPNWLLARSAKLDLKPNTHFYYRKQNYQLIGLIHLAEDFSHLTQSSKLATHTQTYFNHCYMLPSEVSYSTKAPAQSTPINGVQTAIIDQLSEGGVSLTHHWNSQTNPQKSQHSVAVLQPLADEKQNIQFTPSAGTEVLVGYENGDPEHPLVLATCYNAEQTPPFGLGPRNWLSGCKTLEQNALCFNDTPGSEQISLVAKQDLLHTVSLKQELKLQGNYRQTVGHDAKIVVKRYSVEAPQILLKAGQSLISIKPDEIRVESSNTHLN